MVRCKQFCLPLKCAAVPEIIDNNNNNNNNNNKAPRKMQTSTSVTLLLYDKMANNTEINEVSQQNIAEA